MKIRNKILLYFSTTVISLTVISSVIIYVLSAAFREEEFQQRQKQKIELTVKFIKDYKEMSEELIKIMDRLTIHDFYDEKMLIFDNNKIPIYKSIDDLEIGGYRRILNDLSPSHQWIETKEDQYDLIGVYIESGSTHLYAISKAYDEFGYTKLEFLRNILIAITIMISVAVLIITSYLSRRLSRPITEFAEAISFVDINDDYLQRIHVQSSSYEMKYLAEKFNQLLERTNEAFDFQKYAVHHISHELKTPITILVSELELIESTELPGKKSDMLHEQIVRAKSLGEIIDVLLELSKIEAGQDLKKEAIRVDEIIFGIIEEESIIHPSFTFDVQFNSEIFEESRLYIQANRLLFKQALYNIIDNCIKFSIDSKAVIRFDVTGEALRLIFINAGKTILKEEEKYIFQHFFRGRNNKNTKGFGLGLVLTKRILALHDADISYSSPDDNLNMFTLIFTD